MHEFESPLKPETAEILGIKQETPNIKTFKVRFIDKKRQKKFFFIPGKFMMVSIFGFGEMPISISSSPYKTDSLELTVNAVGNISRAMHRLKKNDIIGLRGPFGKGYPLQTLRKKNIVFFSGGCGFASLRSAVLAANAKKQMFGKLFVFHGCKSPQELLFEKDIKKWPSHGIETFVSVDNPSPQWKGYSGYITDVIDKAEIPVENTAVLLCGPEPMVNIALKKFRKKGFSNGQMFASLERLMHCGIGKCGHCNIAGKYVCVQGPVFSGKELEKMDWGEI